MFRNPQKNLSKEVSGNNTVMVVEDEASIRNLIERTLKKFGYTVLTAHDGQEGLDVYRENHEKINMVLLDLTIPKISGKKLLEKIIKINPDAKVIISSGQSREDMEEFDTAKGFLTKPYHIEDLVSLVRNTIDMI